MVKVSEPETKNSQNPDLFCYVIMRSQGIPTVRLHLMMMMMMKIQESSAQVKKIAAQIEEEL